MTTFDSKYDVSKVSTTIYCEFMTLLKQCLPLIIAVFSVFPSHPIGFLAAGR